MIQITQSQDIVHNIIELVKEFAPAGWEISRYVPHSETLSFFNGRGKVFIDEVARERISLVGDRVSVNVNFFTGQAEDTDNLYDEMALICGFLSNRTVYNCGIYHIPSDGVTGLTRVENTYIAGSQWLCSIEYYVTRKVLPVE